MMNHPDDLLPMATLRLAGEPGALITDISTPEDWRDLWDELQAGTWAEHCSDGPGPIDWELTFSTMRRADVEALPEFTGW